MNAGPLAGLHVVEFSGQGSAPVAAMILADLGATVTAIDRPGFVVEDVVAARGKFRATLDLKTDRDREEALRRCADVDVVLEGFRPGVMERLGVGPDDVERRNPRVVYARLTGFGQDGPMSHRRGHDIMFLALSGLLGATSRPGVRPQLSANHLGDMGAGATFCVIGILAALLERAKSGRGQVVDAAVLDGASILATSTWNAVGAGTWGPPGTNLWDGGAPFYDCYATADGRWYAVGALEPDSFDELVTRLGLPHWVGRQDDRAAWHDMRRDFASTFAARRRSHWERVFANSDCCTAPVLAWDEVPAHPQVAARTTIVTVDGRSQPAPAPRFSRSATSIDRLPRHDQ